MNSLAILIADDHPLFRKGMRSLLEIMPDITFVGEAKSGQEAVEMALAHQPDIVLMDLQMPGGSGLAATRELSKRSPRTRILVVTLFEDNNSIAAIAEQLIISLKTVRNHVSNIYNKFQVADRAQAAIRARDAGLR